MRQAYVAGPYTGTVDEVQRNVEAALAAASRLASLGYLPICPHVMGPHRNQTWDAAMERCTALIRGLDPTLDLVVMLPGWRESRGSLVEHGLAFMHNIPTVELEDVLEGVPR